MRVGENRAGRERQGEDEHKSNAGQLLAARMLTIADLVKDLRHLGVPEGGTVMLHASMRAIGAVDGGAASVVRALETVVTPSGTILMVLGARDDWAWINARPEEGRWALLSEAKPFDAEQTPADPEVGVLAEVFRRMPGTCVSDHPEGRFGARGLRCLDLTRDVPWNDYYGPGSPLHRLVDLDGSVLRLGADSNTVTLFHYAEYLADLPNKRRVRRHRLVAGPVEPQVRIVECLDDSEGITNYPGEDYFADILTDFMKDHRGNCGLVGNARSELLRASELVEFASNWMSHNLNRV